MSLCAFMFAISSNPVEHCDVFRYFIEIKMFA